MKPIPVVATKYNNPDKVVLYKSVREAARSLGNEEALRKSIARACNEEPDGGLNVKTSRRGSWYVEYLSSHLAR